jgi:hypothetical protein
LAWEFHQCIKVLLLQTCRSYLYRFRFLTTHFRIVSILSYFRNIRRFLFSNSLPVNTSEERMCFNFFNSVNTKSFIYKLIFVTILSTGIADKSLKKINSSRAKISFRRNNKCLSPVKNLLAGQRWVFREEWRISNKHFE